MPVPSIEHGMAWRYRASRPKKQTATLGLDGNDGGTGGACRLTNGAVLRREQSAFLSSGDKAGCTGLVEKLIASVDMLSAAQWRRRAAGWGPPLLWIRVSGRVTHAACCTCT